MQKTILFVICSLFLNTITFAQTPSQIIKSVESAQRALTSVTYRVVRKDTLVTGDVRTITGHVKLLMNPESKPFGFMFSAKEDGVHGQLVFNGNMAYETDDDTKVYSMITNQEKLDELLYHAGGRVVVPDLVKLDTAKAKGLTLTQDKLCYFLTISYPDLKAYDVEKRYKRIKIDKKTMLPVSVRIHQETLGKIQDLFWQIEDVNTGETIVIDNFLYPDFLKTYSQKVIQVPANNPLLALKGKSMPFFELKSFDSKIISSRAMIGKVVLLDFWEVWCGPCIESMPKVQQLFAKYKDRGLIVYGITSDLRQLESSKRFILRRREIKFPMLIGGEQLKKDFMINAVPQYVLADRTGKIRFLSLGFSGEIDAEIEKLLNEN